MTYGDQCVGSFNQFPSQTTTNFQLDPNKETTEKQKLKSTHQKTNLNVTLFNEKLGNTKMIRKQKPSRRETKPRTCNNSPSFLSLNILHSLFPNNLGLDLILHHYPNSLLKILTAIYLFAPLRNRKPFKLFTESPVACFQQSRGQPQEKFTGDHGEGFPLGIGGLGGKILIVLGYCKRAGTLGEGIKIGGR